jgi:hypothetical protein
VHEERRISALQLKKSPLFLGVSLRTLYLHSGIHPKERCNMKYLMWALIGLLLFAACTPDAMETKQEGGASAQLLNLERYQQENSYAFECNTGGFSPHTFLWDFGDGTTRETKYKGVAHTYFKSGTYTVTCIASDDVQNQTSTLIVDVEVTGGTEYEDILGDLDLVDLLSDTTNTTPPLNWSHNTTYVPEDDYTFDFEFDEEEEPRPRRTSSNSTNSTNTTTNSTNATNSSNSTNTTGVGTIISPNTTNTTNNTGNGSDDPFDWPELNVTDNETIIPPVLPPETADNESDDGRNDGESNDSGNQNDGDTSEDVEGPTLKANKGKLKKELSLRVKI